MKIIYLLFVLLLVSITSYSQTFEEITRKADSCYFERKFSDSKFFFSEAFQKYPNEKRGYYNAACVASLSADYDLAFKWLDNAIRFGFNNLEQLKQEKDFNNLHVDTRWMKLIERLQTSISIEEANYDKAAQKELIDIFNSDQYIRYQFLAARNKYGLNSKVVDSLLLIMHTQDSLNLAKIEKLISEKGWLGANKVGVQASNTLFLVIQHSNLKTQKRYRPILERAVKLGNAPASSLAFLDDRIAVFEGRKQMYGTQLYTDPKTNITTLSPLEDPANVDLRRASVGLEPLREYLKACGNVK